ncbi:MAG TPA: transposase [Cellvibrionaceae bacterium]
MPHYSPERKEAILQKMAPLQSLTVAELSSQEGISTATLYNWRAAARKRGAVLRSNSAIPDKWRSEEEFRIALETAPCVIVVRSEMDRLLFTPVQPQTGI